MKVSTKARAERFRKRKHGLIKKAYELGNISHADVYLVIHHKGRYFTYNSSTVAAWPPSPRKLVSFVKSGNIELY
jgi:hypothetical protein